MQRPHLPLSETWIAPAHLLSTTVVLGELFLRHTYLVSVTKLMVWAALSQGKTTESLRSVANDVFSGRYFESKRLGNLAESDFFHWISEVRAEETLAPIWEMDT